MASLANIWELQKNVNQFNRYVKNPSKSNLDTGNYFPRLTYYGKWFRQDASVRIEFSIPKLVYLNNLDELDNADFSNIISILKEIFLNLLKFGYFIPRNN